MNINEKNVRRKFELRYNLGNRTIDKVTRTDHTEYIFEISDGTKIMYDDLDDVMITIKPKDDKCLTEEEWNKEFVRRLRKMMRIRAMSQKELAHAVGVTENSMTNYMNGRRTPRFYIILRMSEVLRCSINYLTNFDYLL